MPLELTESEDHELFVPADVQPDIFTREQHLMDWHHQQYNPTQRTSVSPRTSADRKRHSG